MNRTGHCLLPLLVIAGWLFLPATAHAQEEEPVRFRPLDIFICPGNLRLAAYQLKLVAKSGDAKIVGVEGGDHPAFRKAPYYDPAALMTGQIILAAYSTSEELPTGPSRLLRVHVRESGPAPVYDLELLAAADPQGKKIPARVWIGPGDGGKR